MTLPDAIPVRYSEEEAGYVSFRPVIRQTFRLHELLDMVLSVTGKNAERIRLILRTGNVVFHFYHYWWEGFEAPEDELAALLRQFPDPDPGRLFSPSACTLALLEEPDAPRHPPVELPRAAFSRKGLFQRRSFWDALLAAAKAGPLAYRDYSYTHHADVYLLELTGERRAQLSAGVALAPGALRQSLRALDRAARVEYVCPLDTA